MTMLAHLTLVTGDLQMVPAHAVEPEKLVQAGALLTKALAGGVAELPASYGVYAIAAERFGDAIFVQVLGATPDRRNASRVAAFGVAPRSKRDLALWRRLNDELAKVLPGQPSPAKPSAPWCGAAILPGLLDHPDAADWLGEFEQAIAWAWLARVR